MSPDLEVRRRAVADALRAVMAEPLPRRAVVEVATSTREHRPARLEAASPPEVRPSLRESLAAQIDGDTTDDDRFARPAGTANDVGAAGDDADVAAESPRSVPRLEPTGSMSRAASMALFGHA
jgi:hypothetical protein